MRVGVNSVLPRVPCMKNRNEEMFMRDAGLPV